MSLFHKEESVYLNSTVWIVVDTKFRNWYASSLRLEGVWEPQRYKEAGPSQCNKRRITHKLQYCWDVELLTLTKLCITMPLLFLHASLLPCISTSQTVFINTDSSYKSNLSILISHLPQSSLLILFPMSSPYWRTKIWHKGCTSGTAEGLVNVEAFYQGFHDTSLSAYNRPSPPNRFSVSHYS